MTQPPQFAGASGSARDDRGVEPERSDPGIGPLVGLLGIRRRRMAAGEACFDLTVRPDHMNPYGVLHGGLVYPLVDDALGAALVTRLEPGERCATLEVKIQYLVSVSAGEVRAEARVVEWTRRIGAYAGGDRRRSPPPPGTPPRPRPRCRGTGCPAGRRPRGARPNRSARVALSRWATIQPTT